MKRSDWLAMLLEMKNSEQICVCFNLKCHARIISESKWIQNSNYAGYVLTIYLLHSVLAKQLSITNFVPITNYNNYNLNTMLQDFKYFETFN